MSAPGQPAPPDGTLRVQVGTRSYKVHPGFCDAHWERIRGGGWEPETFAVFDRFLGVEDTYLDIGAFIGPTVLYAGQLARRALAVEPDPVSFAELSRNVQLNPALRDKVRCVHACLAAVDGPVSLGNPDARGGTPVSSMLFAQGQSTWTVAGRTLRTLLREHGVERVDFIKMDIEGAEYRVLPQLRRDLEEFRPTLCLSLHFDYLLKDARGRNLWDDAGPLRCAWLKNVIRPWRRLRANWGVIRALSSYPRLYDMSGKRLSPWSLLFRRCNTLVATHREW